MNSMPPPFDAELQGIANAWRAQKRSTLTADEIAAFRVAADIPTGPSNRALGGHGAFYVEERNIPGPSGSPDISLLICRPSSTAAPKPVVYYLHGGGMVMGSNRTTVDYILEWARELDLTVVSVEYRLAPENPYPAGLDDCFAGLEWLAEHAEEIGIDPAKIIVAGMSGGGGLAAALCLLVRDRQGPQPLGQILMEPMIDDRDTFSARQMEGSVNWDRVTNQMAWGHVLGDKYGTDAVSAYAAPARAEDLSGLPPTYLDVGSAETFRDEVVSYASRIWQAGGAAELHVWPGGFHGFEIFVPRAALSQAARAARLSWLRRLLNT